MSTTRFVVAVVSLAGTLNVGLAADPALLADVDHLAADIQAEAAALMTACRAADRRRAAVLDGGAAPQAD